MALNHTGTNINYMLLQREEDFIPRFERITFRSGVERATVAILNQFSRSGIVRWSDVPPAVHLLKSCLFHLMFRLSISRFLRRNSVLTWSFHVTHTYLGRY